MKISWRVIAGAPIVVTHTCQILWVRDRTSDLDSLKTGADKPTSQATPAMAMKTQTGEQPQRPGLSLITTGGLSRDIFALPAQN